MPQIRSNRLPENALSAMTGSVYSLTRPGSIFSNRDTALRPQEISSSLSTSFSSLKPSIQKNTFDDSINLEKTLNLQNESLLSLENEVEKITQTQDLIKRDLNKAVLILLSLRSTNNRSSIVNENQEDTTRTQNNEGNNGLLNGLLSLLGMGGAVAGGIASARVIGQTAQAARGPTTTPRTFSRLGSLGRFLFSRANLATAAGIAVYDYQANLPETQDRLTRNSESLEFGVRDLFQHVSDIITENLNSRLIRNNSEINLIQRMLGNLQRNIIENAEKDFISESANAFLAVIRRSALFTREQKNSIEQRLVNLSRNGEVFEITPMGRITHENDLNARRRQPGENVVLPELVQSTDPNALRLSEQEPNAQPTREAPRSFQFLGMNIPFLGGQRVERNEPHTQIPPQRLATPTPLGERNGLTTRRTAQSAGTTGAGAGRAVSSQVPPEGRALLDAIAQGEGGREGYNAINYVAARTHGTRFEDFSRHPFEGQSGYTAAGRYQILWNTFNPYRQRLGLRDFSPESQDRAAWALAQDVYSRRTRRNLEEDLRNPEMHALITQALAPTWHALQGAGGQRFMNTLSQEIGRSATPSPNEPATAPGEMPTQAQDATPTNVQEENPSQRTAETNGQNIQPTNEGRRLESANIVRRENFEQNAATIEQRETTFELSPTPPTNDGQTLQRLSIETQRPTPQERPVTTPQQTAMASPPPAPSGGGGGGDAGILNTDSVHPAPGLMTEFNTAGAQPAIIRRPQEMGMGLHHWGAPPVA